MGILPRKNHKKKLKTVGRPKVFSERSQQALENVAGEGRMTARKVMNQIAT